MNFFLGILIFFELFQAITCTSSNDTLKSHYVVFMVEEIPFLIKSKNGTYSGYCVDLMDGISLSLNFTYEIRIPQDNKYGTLENGEWNGMVKDLLEGEGDIISGAFTITSERSQFIDFTVPFYGFAGMTIIMKKQANQDDLFSFTKVFSWQVWLAVGVITIGMGILVFIFEKFSPYSSINTRSETIRNTEIKFSFKESIWLACGTLTLSGAESPPYTFSTRILLSGFWIFCSILIMTYQANLSASSTISRLDNSITSLQDLSNQRKVEYSCVAGTTVQTYFEEMSDIEKSFYEFWKTSSLTSSSLDENCESSKLNNCKWRYYTRKDMSVFGGLEYKSLYEYPLSRTYSTLAERIKKVGYLNNTAEGLEKVLKAPDDSPFAFISQYPVALYETNLNCDLQIVGSQFSTRPYAIGLRKNSPLKSLISDKILSMQRDLNLDELKTKWWGTRIAKCKSDSDSSDSLIRLNTTGGAFIIIANAIAFAFLVLFLDLIKQRVTFKPKPSTLTTRNHLKNNLKEGTYKNGNQNGNKFFE